MNSKLYFTITLVVLAWLGIDRASADTTTQSSTATPTATGNTTVAPKTTVMTTAPPLVFNDTVTALQTDVSNADCGTDALCVSIPSSCTPSAASCTFFRTKSISGQNFEFSLTGDSEGYVAISLATGTVGQGDTTYICFNKNGTIAFAGASLNGNALTKRNVSAANVKGKLNGQKIQCTFDATVPSSSSKAATLAVGVLSGAYNSSAGSFGPATTLIQTDPVDLSNPKATITNLLAVATMAPNVTTMAPNSTTNSAMSFQKTLIQAMMISAGVMGLTML